MSDDRPARVFAGQAKEHQGKYGKYLTLRMGLVTYFLEPSKTPGLMNVYIKENPREDRQQNVNKGHHDGHADDGMSDDRIPF